MVHINAFKGKKVYFIGIGGCSMNGLAQILHSRGYHVSGSDRTASNFTKKLEDIGIDVHIGHDPHNIDGADLIVYSAAIKPDNAQMLRAKELDIPCIDRATLLGQLSSQFEDVVCIAGCHGKTTITSMAAMIFDFAKMDATVHVGGEVAYFDSGISIGQSAMFLTEACEYVESFLTLSPTSIVLNNIDDDHLDYYKSIDNIVRAFEKFVALLPQDGALIVNADDERAANLAKAADRRTIYYGLSSCQGYHARNITFNDQAHASFECYDGERFLFHVALHVPGEHNVQNALAAIAVSRLYGISDEAIIGALSRYQLAKRRLELYGTLNGASVYHDYAHHPSEIAATLKALHNMRHEKLWCVFQCNSYSRAITLKDKYALSFSHADVVIVPDIYPGRETDTGAIHAKDLADAIRGASCNDTRYIATFEEIAQCVKNEMKPGDILVGLGSGDIYLQLHKIL